MTKEGTEVYTDKIDSEHLPEYSKKKVHLFRQFQQRDFHSLDVIQEERIGQILANLQTQLREQQRLERMIPVALERHQMSREDMVNRKRRLIKRCIENRGFSNIAEIARVSKCHRDTVKKVTRDLQYFGDVSQYHYNNTKTAEDTNSLVRTIEEESQGFITVSTIKRKHPKFSKKKILKTLHQVGLSYRLMPKARLNPVVRIVDSTSVCRVISHIVQAMADPNTTLLFCDEMKLPLTQTAEKRWIHKDSINQEMLTYNRRPALDYTLNVIAMCSLTKFEAVQVYMRDVNSPDFLCFINTAISKMPSNKSYTVLVDNAGWHVSQLVKRATASKFLHLNVPYQFQLNIIENAFSFIRNAFRNRPIVDTLEAETRLIVNIFFDEYNPKRFEGLLRNYLKTLIEFLNKHRGRMQNN